MILETIPAFYVFYNLRQSLAKSQTAQAGLQLRVFLPGSPRGSQAHATLGFSSCSHRTIHDTQGHCLHDLGWAYSPP